MRLLTRRLSARSLFLLIAVTYTSSLMVLSLMRTSNLDIPSFKNVDKVFHFIAYFGLTLVWYLYYYASKPNFRYGLKPILIICLCTLGFGIFIEVLQGTLTTYRSEDIYDALANSAGVFSAFLLICVGRQILKKS